MLAISERVKLLTDEANRLREQAYLLDVEAAQLAATMQNMTDTGVEATNKSVSNLILSNKDQLKLLTGESFFTHFLDALPIQIFIKEAAFDKVKGRRYIYLNKAARDILKWQETDVKDHFDTDAFSGGNLNPEWAEMVKVETSTIENENKTEETLKWTSAVDSRSWRINKTIQLPISAPTFSQPEKNEVVGLCAIALDNEFRQEIALHSTFLQVLLHEYGNLSAILISIFEKAKSTPSKYVEYIDSAAARVQVANHIARRMFYGFRVANGGGQKVDCANDINTINEVLEFLKKLFTDLPVNLELRYPELPNSEYRLDAPNATLAVLLELLRNAEKYTGDNFLENGRCIVRLNVCLEVDWVSWTISNRRNSINNKLVFLEKPISAGLGGTIIGKLLQRSFRGSRPEDLVIFPDVPDEEKWVNVIFRTPRNRHE